MRLLGLTAASADLGAEVSRAGDEAGRQDLALGGLRPEWWEPGWLDAAFAAMRR